MIDETMINDAMIDKNTQLSNAIKCSELMLEDAQAGNWDNVINIEIQRGELLAELFSSNNPNNNPDGMDLKIRKIIDINRKLEAITTSARETARDDLSAMTKGRSAVNLYAQNSN